MQQSLAVQTRQLQVDRKKVQLLQEISSSMSVIAAELINLRALYTTVNGFEFTTVIPEQWCVGGSMTNYIFDYYIIILSN